MAFVEPTMFLGSSAPGQRGPLLLQSPPPSFMTRAHPTAYLTTGALPAPGDCDSDDGYETPLDEPLPKKTGKTASGEVTGENGEGVSPAVTVEKVVEQLEYYFSDDNLLRDAFLMKHITRNKEGYVSLKLIASLRKIKGLSKDHDLIKAAVEKSEKMSLNSDGSKLRRLAPPPKIDYSSGARSVLVLGLADSTSSQDVEETLKALGEVVRVRVFRPKRAIPLEIKVHTKIHPEIGTENIAVVEFASTKIADLVCEQKCTGEFRFEKLSKKEKSSKSEKTVSVVKKTRKSGVDVVIEREGSSCSSSEGESLSPKPVQKPRFDRKCGSPRRETPWSKSSHFLQASDRLAAARDSDSGNSHVYSSPSPSPELKRRFRGFLKTGTSPQQVCVSRQPRGPDGGRGFVNF